MSRDFIIGEIEYLAKLKYNGDLAKAANEHFRNHPDDLAEYRGVKVKDDRDLLTKQIKRSAQSDHDGDFEKAAAERFSLHPEDYRGVDNQAEKQAEKDRSGVLKTIDYRILEIAERNGLDLTKAADRERAVRQAFKDDPELYRRWKTATAEPCWNAD
jgi:hypothetical protein